MKNLNQEKQRIVDSLVRDICSVSVAPGPKSKVRAIVSSGFDALHAAVVREFRKSVNDKEKQEQILATLLLKVGDENEEVEIIDADLITNDWVVFERRNMERASTIYKVMRNQPLPPNKDKEE